MIERRYAMRLDLERLIRIAYCSAADIESPDGIGRHDKGYYTLPTTCPTSHGKPGNRN